MQEVAYEFGRHCAWRQYYFMEGNQDGYHWHTEMADDARQRLIAAGGYLDVLANIMTDQALDQFNKGWDSIPVWGKVNQDE